MAASRRRVYGELQYLCMSGNRSLRLRTLQLRPPMRFPQPPPSSPTISSVKLRRAPSSPPPTQGIVGEQSPITALAYSLAQPSNPEWRFLVTRLLVEIGNGASKIYPQQAGTIRKNGHIVNKGLPCKIVEVSTSKTGKHGHAKCHFLAIDIFTANKLEDIVPSSHNCNVPHVIRLDYQLIDISEDEFVSLLTESGGTKDDLWLPTDDALLTQLKDGFAAGKDLVLSVMSAMGEEQICAVKDIAPK